MNIRKSITTVAALVVVSGALVVPGTNITVRPAQADVISADLTSDLDLEDVDVSELDLVSQTATSNTYEMGDGLNLTEISYLPVNV